MIKTHQYDDNSIIVMKNIISEEHSSMPWKSFTQKRLYQLLFRKLIITNPSEYNEKCSVLYFQIAFYD